MRSFALNQFVSDSDGRVGQVQNVSSDGEVLDVLFNDGDLESVLSDEVSDF